LECKNTKKRCRVQGARCRGKGEGGKGISKCLSEN